MVHVVLARTPAGNESDFRMVKAQLGLPGFAAAQPGSVAAEDIGAVAATAAPAAAVVARMTSRRMVPPWCTVRPRAGTKLTVRQDFYRFGTYLTSRVSATR